MNAPAGWLTTEQVATRLSCHRNYVCTLARTHGWRRTKSGRVVYYHPDDISNRPVSRAIRTDPTSPGYALALTVTNQRLAIELARTAIRIGRVAEALEILDVAAGERAGDQTKTAQRPRRGAA